MPIVGSPIGKLASYDWKQAFKVAGYVGASAAIVSFGQTIMGWDFSEIVIEVPGFAKLNGQVIATGVVNFLLFLGKRLFSNTVEVQRATDVIS